MTVANELAKTTGLKLFHDHLSDYKCARAGIANGSDTLWQYAHSLIEKAIEDEILSR